MEWWNNFLDAFNEKCDFLDSWPITDLQTDACASGLGAFFKGDWFYSNLLVVRVLNSENRCLWEKIFIKLILRLSTPYAM